VTVSVAQVCRLYFAEVVMTQPEHKDTPPTPPRMDLPPDLEAIYANLVRITHSPSELVIDFAQLLPGASQANIKARVIMSPLSAKLFHRALAENLAKFEANFGEIPMPGEGSLAARLFRPPSPPQSGEKE
jgi:hypothetical protein